MRFLQTGMRIIIQLRLRQAALARATGRASWRTKKRNFDLFLECCEVLIHNMKKIPINDLAFLLESALLFLSIKGYNEHVIIILSKEGLYILSLYIMFLLDL